MLPELLVTDFAGTTMADDGVVLAAYRAALGQHEIPFSEDDLAARRGASKRAVFEELAAREYGGDVSDLAGQALETFQSALRREYEAGDIREISGAGETLRLLRRSNVRLALTSGFERELIELLVDRLGWSGLFDTLVGSDDVPAGRPAPFMIYQAMMALDVSNVADVAVVGDTPLDLQAGSNARAGWVVGVLSGAHGIETLGTAPHTHLLPDVSRLPALFDLPD